MQSVYRSDLTFPKTRPTVFLSKSPCVRRGRAFSTTDTELHTCGRAFVHPLLHRTAYFLLNVHARSFGPARAELLLDPALRRSRGWRSQHARSSPRRIWCIASCVGYLQ